MLVVAVVTIGGILALLAQERVGAPPAITVESERPAISKANTIHITAEEPVRGLSGLLIELEQDGKIVPLGDEHHTPRPFWAFWGPFVARRDVDVAVGTEYQDWLKEGDVTIQVTATRASTWFESPPPVVVMKHFPVRLRPPSLAKLSTFVYVAQGGSEAVVYNAGPTAVQHGVRAGQWFFPGFPLPGGKSGDYFSLFSVPYDMTDPEKVRLVASDEVGNTAEVPIIEKFFPRPVTTETIEVSDTFLARVVPAILSNTPEIKDAGNPLQNYLAINGELRKKNAMTLIELSKSSAQQFLWTKTFLQMPNTKVMSAFADRRTYMYQGKAVDQQDHLGFDLASTKQAPIPAANDGVVVLARYFGIYGNAVVLDHGYGVMSLYGHLSSLEVKEGQKVTRGDSLGRSGETGLAGGDHLHFTMLLHGLPVSPVEWWDSHWIEDRLKEKLAAALPYDE
jgi:murein DD-endopeptidase MepM/ murein hydrolase activator NlpD